MQKNQAITKTPLRGIEVLDSPNLNKGTAFTEEEREQLGLVGLLPDSVEDIDRQLDRVLGHLKEKPTDLERYIYLIGLCDRNETLFYKLLMSDPMRFLPIVYDPTVAEACLKFGYIYRRSRGMYVSIHHKGRVAEVLRNWPVKDVRFICVSTGGRILGLGDIGANGIGIPIGKLQLYTACAAVPPDCLLPILLDTGSPAAEIYAKPVLLYLCKGRTLLLVMGSRYTSKP
jgi:malate dehydrogenase (oxaloacetate-decarboxylating)(NADP+)